MKKPTSKQKAELKRAFAKMDRLFKKTCAVARERTKVDQQYEELSAKLWAAEEAYEDLKYAIEHPDPEVEL